MYAYRSNVAKELFETERDYCENLKVVREVWMDTLGMDRWMDVYVYVCGCVEVFVCVCVCERERERERLHRETLTHTIS